MDDGEPALRPCTASASCGCRKRVRVRQRTVGARFGTCAGSGRVEADALCDGLADVRATWRYSLTSPLQVGCRRMGRPGRYATTSEQSGGAVIDAPGLRTARRADRREQNHRRWRFEECLPMSMGTRRRRVDNDLTPRCSRIAWVARWFAVVRVLLVDDSIQVRWDRTRSPTTPTA